MNKGLARNKIIFYALFSVFLVLALLFVHLTTKSMAFRLLKDCILVTAFLLFILLVQKGFRASLALLKLHKKELLHCFLIEAALLIYLGVFVFTQRGITKAYGRVSLLFGAILMCVFLLTFIFMCFYNWPLHRVYLFLSLTMGTIMLFLSEPVRIPDENIHIRSAYALSNKEMGVEELTDGMTMMRRNDYWYIRYHQEDPFYDVDLQMIDLTYWNVLLSKPKDESLVRWNFEHIETPLYQYFVPSLGITIGRLLHWNSALTLAFGRFLNLLLFTLLTYFAIRLTPVGKCFILILALTPMSLQQAASFSYDALINGLGFFIVGASLFLACKKEKEVSLKKQLLLCAFLGAACFLIIPTKHYAYFALSFLPLMIVLARKNTTRSIRIAAGAILVLSLAILFFGLVSPSISSKSSEDTPAEEITAEDLDSDFVVIKEGTAVAYSLSYYLSHPIELITVLNGTLYNLGGLVTTLIGSSLGWLSVPVSTIAIYTILVLLVLAMLPREYETATLSASVRAVMVLSFLLCSACIFGGMLLRYTPASSTSIKGVQGRYFICCLPALFLALKKKTFSAPASLDRTVILTNILAYFWVAEYVLRTR